MKLLVLDFGGSSVKYSLIDDRRQRSRTGSRPAPLASPEEFATCVASLYDEVGEGADGVAISMPGFINGETGHLRTGGAYVTLAGQNVYELLRDRVSVPVTAENDGKCAALAELWVGSLQGVRDGVVVILGTGIAGGIVHEGRIFRGSSGTAGEFSYMGMPTSLNLRDSMLYRCSMAGLTFEAARALGVALERCPYAPLAGLFGLSPWPVSELDREERFRSGIDGRLFFTLLEEGEPRITALYQDYLAAVASMLLSVQSATDPEYIALGGGVTRQPRFFGDVCRELEKFDAFLGGGAVPKVRLRLCSAGEAPNEFGAAYSFFKTHGVI